VEKVCKVCLTNKPIEEFYKHPRGADGYQGKCKDCQKAMTLKARAANPEHYREYDRARGKLPHRVKAAIEQTKKWRDADKRRLSCHNAVARALRKGTIEPKPCCVCGSIKAFAHHESYNAPLDVVWYCQTHHKVRHKEMALAGIDPLILIDEEEAALQK